MVVIYSSQSNLIINIVSSRLHYSITCISPNIIGMCVVQIPKLSRDSYANKTVIAKAIAYREAAIRRLQVP
jgi:hypothetical protein